MAILSGPPSPRKAPSLTGKVYVTTWRGQVILKKWPRKRTRPIPPAQALNAEFFRQAGKLVPRLSANQQMVAREAVKGTPLYYRDVLTMAMMGTLYALRFDDGRVLHSVATREGVSQTIDALGQDAQSVLVRSDSLWVPVRATDVGQVLQSISQPPYFKFDDIPGPNNSGVKKLATTSVGTASEIKIQSLSLPTTGIIQIRLSNVRVQSANGSLWMRVEQGGSWTAANYKWNRVLQTSNGAWFRVFNNSSGVYDLTFFGSADGISNASTANAGGIITIGGLSTSHYIPIHSDFTYQSQNGDLARCLNGGGLANSGAITGIQVLSSAGNLTNAEMTIVHLE